MLRFTNAPRALAISAWVAHATVARGWWVELSTAWLEWLVMGASHELMLFASVGILLIGLDDLFSMRCG